MLLHDLVGDMDYTKDYYRILGVTPDSDSATIRAAYKTLMVKYDPDQNRSAEAPGITKSLTEAINILDNEIFRLKYDQYRLRRGKYWYNNSGGNLSNSSPSSTTRPIASSLNAGPTDKSRTILGVGGLLVTLTIMALAVASVSR